MTLSVTDALCYMCCVLPMSVFHALFLLLCCSVSFSVSASLVQCPSSPFPCPFLSLLVSFFSHHRKAFPCGYRQLCLTCFQFSNQRRKDALPSSSNYKNPEKRPFSLSLRSQGQDTISHWNLWLGWRGTAVP